MIAKFLSKYGLATHLAVLAALPFALMPFLTAATLGSVILWLAALAAVWLIIEPSLRIGEHLSRARMRFLHQVVRDPLFWLLVLIVVFSFLRWVNSGITLIYEPEAGKWSVKAPSWTIFPGSVEDSGYLPFALSVAVSLILIGIRQGIGLMARGAFGLTTASLTGVGGLVAVGCAIGGVPGTESWMTATLGEFPFWPSSFGVWLIVGLVSGVQAEAVKWGFARLLLVFALAGNAAALFFFAPPPRGNRVDRVGSRDCCFRVELSRTRSLRRCRGAQFVSSLSRHRPADFHGDDIYVRGCSRQQVFASRPLSRV